MSTDRPNKTQLELHRARKDFEHYLDRKGFKYEVCEGSWEGGARAILYDHSAGWSRLY